MEKKNVTKQQLTNYIKRLGGILVGFAAAERWEERGEVAEDYQPRSLWSQAETVIVIGVPISLPIIETTPSINYAELYNTTNVFLDQIAYRTSAYLVERGHGAIFLPRDGYSNIEALIEKPISSFSHVWSAYYAGLGTIGYNHLVLNPTYGPRVRYVSIFTNLRLAADKILEKDLCINCKLCQKICPSQAFRDNPVHLVAHMDKKACALYHAELKQRGCYPCGVCAKVCPIGADREVYGSKNRGKLYLEEKSALLEETVINKQYKAWQHIRSHGIKVNG